MIYLCLAHMSGREMDYIKEAFDTNWVAPLGANVDGFEEDLKRFLSSTRSQDNLRRAFTRIGREVIALC